MTQIFPCAWVIFLPFFKSKMYVILNMLFSISNVRVKKWKDTLKKFWTDLGNSNLKKQLQFSHLPPILQIIQVKWAKHGEHWWRNKEEHISEVLLCPRHMDISMWTDHQIYANTGYHLEDLQRVMDDRGGWQEMVKVIGAISMIWCWISFN